MKSLFATACPNFYAQGISTLYKFQHPAFTSLSDFFVSHQTPFHVRQSAGKITELVVSPITVLIRNDISGFIKKHPSPDCRSLKSIYNSNNSSPAFICPCIGMRVICYCHVCLGRFPGGFPPRPKNTTCLHKIT